jgi:hypothetical protein
MPIAPNLVPRPKLLLLLLLLLLKGPAANAPDVPQPVGLLYYPVL